MFKRWSMVVVCLVLAACGPQEPAEVSGAQYGGDTVTSGDGGEVPAQDSGAVAAAPAPVEPEAQTRAAEETEAGPPPGIDWSPLDLASGEAWISCDHDYTVTGDGEALAALDADSIRAALEPCQERDTLRLRYKGKIAGDFTALVERVVDVADELEIGGRVLDIDSSGGQIEDAIRAGDAIAESGWTIWVREDGICHSSCVLVLAAGDMRMVAGRTGIHRMVRIGSAATSRAELDQELRDIHAQVRDYLQRNGASVAVADLMMTVPNRSLRLLTTEELQRFGIEGRNAAEDDLQRIELARKCGQDFVRRKDAFFVAFESQCAETGEEVEDMNTCGLALRERYGFPDRQCPEESPLAEMG